VRLPTKSLHLSRSIFDGVNFKNRPKQGRVSYFIIFKASAARFAYAQGWSVMEQCKEQISALPMTAMEGGNAERLSETISDIPVGKASAPAYSQGCDVCRFCMEQKPVTPLTYFPVGKKKPRLISKRGFLY